MWKSSVSGEFRYFAGASGDSARPPKAMTRAARSRDRKHDAVAEPVVGDRNVVAVTTRPQASICSLVDALAGQKFLQRVAAVGRIAEAERLLRRRRQAAVAQIGARLGAVGGLQLLLEELASPVP